MAATCRRFCSGLTGAMLAAMLATTAFAAPPVVDEAAATPRRPPPRLLSPEEKRLSAVEPGQLRPVQRPVSQVRIPLGPKALADGDRPERVEGTRPLRRAPAAAASAAGRVRDEAARCEAQPSAEASRACRLLTNGSGRGRAG